MPEQNIHQEPQSAWSNRIEQMMHDARPRKDADQEQLSLDQLSSNALRLDNDRLQKVGHAIQDKGMSSEQLVEFGGGMEKEGEYTRFVGNTLDVVDELIGRTAPYALANIRRSSASGALLAYVIIDQTARHDIAMDHGGYKAATEFRAGHDATFLQDLEFVLNSQQGLHLAFENALAGLPDDIDRSIARIGAGAAILGKIAALEFTDDLPLH